LAERDADTGPVAVVLAATGAGLPARLVRRGDLVGPEVPGRPARVRRGLAVLPRRGADPRPGPGPPGPLRGARGPVQVGADRGPVAAVAAPGGGPVPPGRGRRGGAGGGRQP